MNKLNFESPCSNKCKLNENTDICEVCGRTIKEIMNWKFLTDEEREVIVKRVSDWKL